MTTPYVFTEVPTNHKLKLYAVSSQSRPQQSSSSSRRTHGHGHGHVRQAQQPPQQRPVIGGNTGMASPPQQPQLSPPAHLAPEALSPGPVAREVLNAHYSMHYQQENMKQHPHTNRQADFPQRRDPSAPSSRSVDMMHHHHAKPRSQPHVNARTSPSPVVTSPPGGNLGISGNSSTGNFVTNSSAPSNSLPHHSRHHHPIHHHNYHNVGHQHQDAAYSTGARGAPNSGGGRGEDPPMIDPPPPPPPLEHPSSSSSSSSTSSSRHVASMPSREPTIMRRPSIEPSQPPRESMHRAPNGPSLPSHPVPVRGHLPPKPPHADPGSAGIAGSPPQHSHMPAAAGSLHGSPTHRSAVHPHHAHASSSPTHGGGGFGGGARTMPRPRTSPRSSHSLAQQQQSQQQVSPRRGSGSLHSRSRAISGRDEFAAATGSMYHTHGASASRRMMQGRMSVSTTSTVGGGGRADSTTGSSVVDHYNEVYDSFSFIGGVDDRGRTGSTFNHQRLSMVAPPHHASSYLPGGATISNRPSPASHTGARNSPSSQHGDQNIFFNMLNKVEGRTPTLSTSSGAALMSPGASFSMSASAAAMHRGALGGGMHSGSISVTGSISGMSGVQPMGSPTGGTSPNDDGASPSGLGEDGDGGLFEPNIDFVHPFADGVVLGTSLSAESADSGVLTPPGGTGGRSGSVVLGAASPAVATYHLHPHYAANMDVAPPSLPWDSMSFPAFGSEDGDDEGDDKPDEAATSSSTRTKSVVQALTPASTSLSKKRPSGSRMTAAASSSTSGVGLSLQSQSKLLQLTGELKDPHDEPHRSEPMDNETLIVCKEARIATLQTDCVSMENLMRKVERENLRLVQALSHEHTHKVPLKLLSSLCTDNTAIRHQIVCVSNAIQSMVYLIKHVEQATQELKLRSDNDSDHTNPHYPSFSSSSQRMSMSSSPLRLSERPSLSLYHQMQHAHDPSYWSQAQRFKRGRAATLRDPWNRAGIDFVDLHNDDWKQGVLTFDRFDVARQLKADALTQVHDDSTMARLMSETFDFIVLKHNRVNRKSKRLLQMDPAHRSVYIKKKNMQSNDGGTDMFEQITQSPLVSMQKIRDLEFRIDWLPNASRSSSSSSKTIKTKDMKGEFTSSTERERFFRLFKALVMPTKELPRHAKFQPEPLSIPHDARASLVSEMHPNELGASILHQRRCLRLFNLGWTHGKHFNFKKKIDPTLVPFEDLIPFEKSLCEAMVKNTLEAIYGLGFEVAQIDYAEVDDPEFTIVVPPELVVLLDFLAENLHEFYCQARFERRWSASPENCFDKNRVDPKLRAFHKLSDNDKWFARDAVLTTINTVLALNYEVRLKMNHRGYLRSASAHHHQQSSASSHYGGSVGVGYGSRPYHSMSTHTASSANSVSQLVRQEQSMLAQQLAEQYEYTTSSTTVGVGAGGLSISRASTNPPGTFKNTMGGSSGSGVGGASGALSSSQSARNLFIHPAAGTGDNASSQYDYHVPPGVPPAPASDAPDPLLASPRSRHHRRHTPRQTLMGQHGGADPISQHPVRERRGGDENGDVSMYATPSSISPSSQLNMMTATSSSNHVASSSSTATTVGVDGAIRGDHPPHRAVSSILFPPSPKTSNATPSGYPPSVTYGHSQSPHYAPNFAAGTPPMGSPPSYGSGGTDMMPNHRMSHASEYTSSSSVGGTRNARASTDRDAPLGSHFRLNYGHRQGGPPELPQKGNQQRRKHQQKAHAAALQSSGRAEEDTVDSQFSPPQYAPPPPLAMENDGENMFSLAAASRSPKIDFSDPQHHRRHHAPKSNPGTRGGAAHTRGDSIPPPPPPLPADEQPSHSASNSKRGSLRNRSPMPKRHSGKYAQATALLDGVDELHSNGNSSSSAMSRPQFASPTPHRPMPMSNSRRGSGGLNDPPRSVPSPPPLQPPPPSSSPPRRPDSPPPSRSHSRQNTPVGHGQDEFSHQHLGAPSHSMGSASAPQSPSAVHPAIHLRNPRSGNSHHRSPSPGPPPTSSAPPIPTSSGSASSSVAAPKARLHLTHGALHPGTVQIPGQSPRSSAYPAPSNASSPAVSRPPSAQARSHYPPRPVSTPPAIPGSSRRASDAHSHLPPARSPSPKPSVPLRLNSTDGAKGGQHQPQPQSSPSRPTLTLRREKHAKKQAVKLLHVFEGGGGPPVDRGGAGTPPTCDAPTHGVSSPRPMSRR